jgi:predicted ATPase
VDVDVEINITHAGWFFSAESFFLVARYLDKAALDDPFGPPGGGRGVGGR